MKIQSLFMIAGAAIVVAGCAVTKTGTYSVESAYPLGAGISARMPPGPGVPCPNGGPPAECTIGITVTGSNCEATLDHYVLLPPLAQKKFITWKLLTPNYQFCQRSGDGAYLKDPNGESSPFQPWQHPACSDMFKVERLSADGKNYEYYLQFRAGSRICVIDPWMRN